MQATEKNQVQVTINVQPSQSAQALEATRTLTVLEMCAVGGGRNAVTLE